MSNKPEPIGRVESAVHDKDGLRLVVRLAPGVSEGDWRRWIANAAAALWGDEGKR